MHRPRLGCIVPSMAKIHADVSDLRQRLTRIARDLPEVLTPLLGREPLFKGYVYLNPRRCGNPSCRCAQGELHEAWVVRTPKGRGQVSRIAKAEERGQLQTLAGNYRTFRAARRRVAGLLREAMQLMRQIEAARLVDPFAAKGRR